MSYFYFKIKKNGIYSCLLLISFQFTVNAQVAKTYAFANISKVSLPGFPYTSNQSAITTDGENAELALLNKLESNFDKKPSRKVLLSYLRELNKNKSAENQRASKLHTRLANYFARLRLYPQVMKCFFKATVPDDVMDNEGRFIRESSGTVPGDTTTNDVAEAIDSNASAATNVSALLAINTRDSLLLKADSGLFNHNGNQIVSQPIPEKDIVNPFEDGKKGIRYALIVHIQQPVSGKPKIFVKLNQVGHTFVTLIKYNSDSTYIARTFGFYPRKENPLSATPIIPSARSVYKNDEKHDWDEVVGKFISARRFRKILMLVKQYDTVKYNLNKNNCTDFGLNVAALGGISITDTFGRWPLGRGNNPGVTGQSILNGKVINTDTGNKDNLFIYSDIVK